MKFTSDWLTNRAAATPHRLALLIGAQRWTYGELDRLVDGLAGNLHAQGVQPGDLVAVRLPNSLEYVCLIHAIARLGAVLVPLNTRLTEEEIVWQIEHVGAKWLVAAEEMGLVNCERLTVTCDVAEAVSFSSTGHSSPFAAHSLQAVVFTSGTSGKPKGAMLTYANHYASAWASAERLGVQADDVWLSVLPLYHVGGLAVVWRSCLYGTAVSLHPRFDLDAINQDLDYNPITLISLVPTMLRRLLATRTHWPAGLRLILLGGAAASAEMVERANGLPRKAAERNFTVQSSVPLVATTYGLTEAASQVATARPEEATRKPGSVGHPLPGTMVEIWDENGRSLPPNTLGEIVVNGPTVMAGYFIADCGLRIADEGFRNPQSAIRNLRTGDMGYLDEDGDLWVVQRRSDLIVSGGENVYPAEVEAVLKSHPAVTDACVVGVPDAEWGQRVAAAVVLAADTAVTPADLAQFCRDRLAGYKTPRRWLICPELPQTASGKVARQTVAEMFA